MAVYLGSTKVVLKGGTFNTDGTAINNQNKTVTPTTSIQTITADSGYTGLGTVTVNRIPTNYIIPSGNKEITSNGTNIDVSAYSTVSVAVPTGSGTTPVIQSLSITPTTAQQTFNSASIDGYKPVTVAAMPTGTAGNPTATKGTVNNHSISITPSVTNTTGYITGGTKTGTAVTVTANELASGNKTITQNGNNIDVVGYSTVSVNVSGGSGGTSMKTDMVESGTNVASTLSFSSLKGEPTSFYINIDDNVAVGTPSKIAAVVFDGTSLHGQIVTNTTNAQASYSTDFTKSYSNGTLTITSTNASFVVNAPYFITYTYDGGTIDTKDVQVGSGATSITFTGLNDEPVIWSCIFKSNFSTSNGYQRVMAVGKLIDTTLVGFAMDSSAHINSNYWTASYNNGSLTITSQGTNAGGYFHQPGYYQLTYAYDNESGGGSSSNYQTKTITPTTSQQIVTADNGYDALSQVTVDAIPNTYIQPTSTIGATTYRASTSSQTIASGTYHSAAATIAPVSQTNLTAANIKSGTTITISNGQNNLWSVTGTYEGTSSSGMNIQGYLGYATVTATSYTATAVKLTVKTTGTYKVSWMGYRNTTSGTSGSQLYIAGTAYGSAQTTFVNNYGQSVTLTNVSLTANQEIVVRARARSTSYVMGVGNLIIEQTA